MSADSRAIHGTDQERWAQAGLLFRPHAAYLRQREKRFVHLPLALAIARRAKGIPRKIRPARALVLNSLMIPGPVAPDLLVVTATARVILVEVKYAATGSVGLKPALEQLARYAKELERIAKGDEWLGLRFDGSYRKYRRWAAEAGAPFEWSLERAACQKLRIRPDRLGEWQQALGKTIQSGKALAVIAMNSEAVPRLGAERPERPRALNRWRVGVLEVRPERRIRAAGARWVWPRLD